MDFGNASILAVFLAFSMYHCVLFVLIWAPHGYGIPFYSNVHNDMFWVRKHKEMTDTETVTLAVQTLRNTAIVAIFVGGYSFSNATIVILSITKYEQFDLRIAKSIVCLLLFLSFLCWATVIRSSSHLGYHLGVISYMVDKLTILESADHNPADYDSHDNEDDPIGNADLLKAEIEQKDRLCKAFMFRLEFCFRYVLI
jgi:hypothetical protein